MRNLVFLGIISLLIGYIYFFEEKKTIEEYKNRAQAEKLLDIKNAGQILYLKGENFSLAKEGEEFLVEGKFRVSNKALDRFFKELMNLKVQRVLKEDELSSITLKHILPENNSFIEVGFEKSKVRLKIGKKLNFAQTFYLIVENLATQSTKYVVAKYHNTYTGSAQDKEQHRSDMSYNQVLKLFNLESNFFKELIPLYNLKLEKKLVIKSYRNKAYEIDTELKETLPKAPEGVEYIDARFTEYIAGLTQLKALAVFMNKEKKSTLRERLGELIVGEKSYQFYKYFGNKIGYFILNGKYIYQVEPKVFRFVFRPQQFFWKKSLHLAGSEFEIKDHQDRTLLKSKLGDKNIWANLLVREAYQVKENYKKAFTPEYKILNEKQTFLVRNTESGLEVLDLDKDLIFHYLEKIK